MKKIVVIAVFLSSLAVSFFTYSTALPVQTYSQAAGLAVAPVKAAEVKGTSVDPVSVSPLIYSQTKVNGFYIEIDKIGLYKQVAPNVEPSDSNIYGPVLEHMVAHGKYTLLPSEATGSGNVYLFAHREGPSGFFHRLNELKQGDQIKLLFNGNSYLYKVSNSFVVYPTDTWVYTSESATPTLTLQTCENGSKQRLIVKADLVSVSAENN